MLRLATDADVHGDIIRGLGAACRELSWRALRTLCLKEVPILRSWPGLRTKTGS
jgi:hypothetical protein